MRKSILTALLALCCSGAQAVDFRCLPGIANKGVPYGPIVWNDQHPRVLTTTNGMAAIWWCKLPDGSVRGQQYHATYPAMRQASTLWLMALMGEGRPLVLRQQVRSCDAGKEPADMGADERALCAEINAAIAKHWPK